MTSPSDMCDELLKDFLDESCGLLDRLNEDLLTLDEWAASLGEGRQRCDEDLMNRMFRSAHSIKGLSAMLGLGNINQLTHKIENVFDAARKDELALRPSVVETIFRSVDCLASLIENLRENGNDDLDCSAAAEELKQVLSSAGCERKTTNQADAERALKALSAPLAAKVETPTAAPVASAPIPVAPVDLLKGIADEGETPAKYLAIFVDEAEMSLDTMTELLLDTEAHSNREAIESILCTAHRLKGSAASIGLNRPAKLAHLMEDLLHEIREKNASLTSFLVDPLLRCTDALRVYVKNLRSGERRDDLFGSLAGELAAAQTAWRTGGSQSTSHLPISASVVSSDPPAANTVSIASASGPLKTSVVASPQAPAAPSTVVSAAATARGFERSWLDSMRQGIGPAVSAAAVRVHFQPGLPLAGMKAQLILEKLCKAGEVKHCDPPMPGIDEVPSLESLACVLASDLTSAELEKLLSLSGVVLVESETIPFAASADTSVSSAAAEKSPVNSASAARGKPAGEAEAAKNKPAADQGKPNETLRVDIDRLDQLMNLAGQLVINRARFSRIDKRLRESQPNKQTRQVVANLKHLAQRLSREVEGDEASAGANLEAIRSCTRRLASDLGIVEREMEHLAQLRLRVQELGDAVHQLDRVTDGIQRSVMDTRMVPIGPLFSRFKRVVRDITRANGKEIELVIHGEKTELDKRMIDELGDPLIHMVRNSADHGIETPEERAAAGKPRHGTITLDAFHRGNSILVQVQDDGKGLDASRIVKKAIEKNLITQADAERMTPHEIHQLIWAPGFSTAEKVTEISGRGMGMDIVRSKIEELSGTVELTSTPGKGTTFNIRLPLTLAILPSLMARVAGDVFAMPLESVVEIVTIAAHEARSVQGQKVARIRGRVVSIVHLDEIFTWRQASRAVDRGDSEVRTLVIVANEGRELGLVVDAVLGEDDIVIKSLSENYRNVPGVAGASILGDGSVSLILDVPAVISTAARLKDAIPVC